MKNFKRYYLIPLLSTLLSIQAYSQIEDSLQIRDIMNLSIEDLLKIKVSVSSSKSQSVFETPSTVTIIDQEMILNSHTTCTCQVFSPDNSILKLTPTPNCSCQVSLPDSSLLTLCTCQYLDLNIKIS